MESCSPPIYALREGSGRTADRRVRRVDAGDRLPRRRVLALWKDRMSRDGDGYVSIGSTELSADVYAIAGDLRGDGPGWLYGSAIIGDERVRAEFLDGSALLHRHRPRGGCRPLPDGSRACHDRGLRGVLEHSPEARPRAHRRVTRSGRRRRKASASRRCCGPRDGDWSVVFMNIDGSRGVSVRGEASATLPVLPWIGGVLLLLAALSGFIGIRLVLHVRHPQDPSDLRRAACRTSRTGARRRRNDHRGDAHITQRPTTRRST